MVPVTWIRIVAIVGRSVLSVMIWGLLIMLLMVRRWWRRLLVIVLMRRRRARSV